MSIYNGMSGKEVNLEQSYVLLDLAGQVALRVSVGMSTKVGTSMLTCIFY